MQFNLRRFRQNFDKMRAAKWQQLVNLGKGYWEFFVLFLQLLCKKLKLFFKKANKKLSLLRSLNPFFDALRIKGTATGQPGLNSWRSMSLFFHSVSFIPHSDFIYLAYKCGHDWRTLCLLPFLLYFLGALDSSCGFRMCSHPTTVERCCVQCAGRVADVQFMIVQVSHTYREVLI